MFVRQLGEMAIKQALLNTQPDCGIVGLRLDFPDYAAEFESIAAGRGSST